MTKAALKVVLGELMPESPERQFRTMAYPLLAGLGETLGWKVSWVALGVRYEPTLVYRLEPADLSLLVAAVRRRKADVVVINERLTARQRAVLQSAVPGRRVRLLYCPLGESYFSEFAAFARRIDPSAPRGRLAEPDLLETLEPDFSREVLNDAPWAHSPLIRVPVGMRCSYRTHAAKNPFYRDLEGGEATMPCSFCDPSQAGEIRDAVAFAARHVKAAWRRRGAGPGELRFDMIGARLWMRLEQFVAELTKRGVRGAELSFMPRVDEILASREAIRRCLPALAESGLSLRLYGAGVENFSPDENLRLNKGVTAAQVQEAAAFIAQTAQDWPGQFHPPKGGLSMILFTPWTSLDDLRVNLENIELCPLIDRPFALGTRLQLFPGRRVTDLARRDGLIVTGRDDYFYNPGCRTDADQDDLPWRFLHSEVSVLWRLARRISSDRYRLPPDDPECRELDAFLGTPDRPVDPLPLFRQALDAIARRPQTDSLAALLERMPRPAAPAAPPRASEPATEPLSARAEAVRGVVERIRRSRPAAFDGVEFEPVVELALDGSRRVRLALTVSGRRLVLDLLDAGSGADGFLKSRRFRAVYHKDSSPPTPAESAMLSRLLRLLDAGVDARRAGA